MSEPLHVKLKLGAHGSAAGTRILIGDQDVTNHVTRLQLDAAADEPTYLRIELTAVTAEVELADQRLERYVIETIPPADEVPFLGAKPHYAQT